MNKVKGFLVKNGKALAGTVGAATTLVGAGINAFAAETDLTSTVTTGLATVKSDFLSYAAVVLPVGLAIFGTVFAVRKGMQFFKTVSK